MSKHGMFRRAAESLEGGFFGRVFTSYEKIETAWRGGVIYGALSGIRTSRTMARVRRGVSRSVENSLFIRSFKRFFSVLPWMSLRSYGMFLLSLGFYTSVIYAIKSVATSLTADMDALIVGVMLIVLSLPLMFSHKTLAESVTSSGFISYLAFDILGFRREGAEAGREPYSRSDMAFLAGMIAGLATFYIEPLRVISAILSILLLYVVAAKPETGLVLIFALFPFFSDGQLMFFILLVSASYILKFICGRRTLRFDAVDTFMLIFFVLAIMAELINYGIGTGIHADPRRIVFMLMYFLTANLITNQAWRSRLIRSLMFGCSALAVVSIAAFLGETFTVFAETGKIIFGETSGLTNVITQNADASSYYLAMTMPIMIAYFMRRGTGGKRLNMLFFAIVILTAATLTMSRGLWLGALAGVLLFLAACDLRFLLIPVAAAVGLPAALLLLPDGPRAELIAMLDISSPMAQRRVFIRRLSFNIFTDNFLGGIGSGDGVFSAVYDSYTPVGAAADNAQNLFLGIGVGLGIFGLIVFIVSQFLLLAKAFSGAHHGPDSTRRLCSRALASGAFAALVAGMSNDIWIDDRMFLLFFMFAGAVSAYNAVGTERKGEDISAGVVGGDGGAAFVDVRLPRGS